MSIYREHINKGFSRSRGWTGIRRAHLDKHPFCQVCGRTNHLEVHHIKDYSTYPELELDMGNLITLCSGSTRCHFIFGHLGDWGSINPDVVEDANNFSGKIRNRRRSYKIDGIGLFSRLEGWFFERLYCFWER